MLLTTVVVALLCQKVKCIAIIFGALSDQQQQGNTIQYYCKQTKIGERNSVRIQRQLQQSILDTDKELLLT